MEAISAKDVLKLTATSRSTLNRWMDRAEAERLGFDEPFPAGGYVDGKSKEWDRAAVVDWLDRHADRLGRHKTDATRRSTLTLPLDKALQAAERAAEEQGVEFDREGLMRAFIDAMKAAFVQKGVIDVRLDGAELAFDFDDASPSAVTDMVFFRLAYA